MYRKWAIYSSEDPRFNVYGEGFVNIFDGIPLLARIKLRNLKQNLRVEVPKDLMFTAKISKGKYN